jgi:hypothetical protein
MKINIKKVYDKTAPKCSSGSKVPVKSIGTYNKNSFDVVVHMTPELRKHPTERKVLLRHEEREAKLLAEGKSVHYAHRQAASKDPNWLKGEQGYYNIWDRLKK